MPGNFEYVNHREGEQRHVNFPCKRGYLFLPKPLGSVLIADMPSQSKECTLITSSQRNAAAIMILAILIAPADHAIQLKVTGI